MEEAALFDVSRFDALKSLVRVEDEDGVGPYGLLAASSDIIRSFALFIASLTALFVAIAVAADVEGKEDDKEEEG